MSDIFKNTLIAALFYSIITIIILDGLLGPFYIFALDMVFGPNIGTLVPEQVNFEQTFYGFDFSWVSGVLPFLFVLSSIGQMIDAWIIQKTLLFLILFLAGFSAYELCPADYKIGKCFAGLFYTLNPFVYVRFMVGHWLILLSYAITPFVIKLMICFFENKRFKDVVKVTLLLTLVGVFSSHILFLNLFVFIALFFIKLLTTERRFELLKNVALLFSLFLLVNLYWIVPSFNEKTVLTQIGYEDLLAFTSRSWGTGFNILFSLATLHGFWRAPEGYRYISEILPYWYTVYFFILFLTVLGFITKYRDKVLGSYVKVLGIIAIISLIFATGISTTGFSHLFELFFNAIPFFSGFREPQKFVALLALAYSYLGGLGVAELSELGMKDDKRKRLATIILVGLASATPAIYALNMLVGFSGQLKTANYPAEWYTVNEFLSSQTGEFNTLFFPWHKYMNFSWVGRTIANPASVFFSRPIIQGENIELGEIKTQSTKPIQYYIQFLLDHRDEINNFGELIEPLNVKYVVLAKEADYKNYEFLYKQHDLRVILDNPRMTVFENQNKIAKIYWVEEIPKTHDWYELLLEVDKNKDSTVDIVGNKYKVSIFQPINYTKISPVEYIVETKGSGYVIFTESYNDAWILDGKKPIKYLGLTNAFPVDKEGYATLIFTKFKILIIYYMISLSTMFFLIIYLLISTRPPSRHLPNLEIQAKVLSLPNQLYLLVKSKISSGDAE